jgi:hypothetical protein
MAVASGERLDSDDANSSVIVGLDADGVTATDGTTDGRPATDAAEVGRTDVAGDPAQAARTSAMATTPTGASRVKRAMAVPLLDPGTVAAGCGMAPSAPPACGKNVADGFSRGVSTYGRRINPKRRRPIDPRTLERTRVQDQRHERGSGRSSPLLRAVSDALEAPMPRLRGLGASRSTFSSIASRRLMLARYHR